MTFLDNMNNWGKAGVILWYVKILSTFISTSVSSGPYIAGSITALIVSYLVYRAFKDDKVSNGTLFCTVLFLPLGLIAHWLNNKDKERITT